MERDKFYVLNPALRLRNEGDKCTIYRVDDYFHSVDNVTIITSKEAVLLALFDGENDFSEVSRIFFYVLDQDKPEEERNAQVSKIIDNLSVREKEPVLIEKAQANGVIRRYEPEDFVIPASKEKSCPMDMRISAPLSVNFNVATACGFKCLYCYHPLNPVMPYLPLERVDSLVKELKDSGCESIMLTGGDPCIRPDFIEIMKILHKYDLFYSISTKSILSGEQIRRMVEECGLDRIQLNLDSNKPEIVAKLLGCSVDYLRRFESSTGIFGGENPNRGVLADCDNGGCQVSCTAASGCSKECMAGCTGASCQSGCTPGCADKCYAPGQNIIVG